MKVGDRVSVNKVNAKLNPNQLKILNTMLKRGGDEADAFMILDKHKKDVRNLNRM